jgi:hypothetical protein
MRLGRFGRLLLGGAAMAAALVCLSCEPNNKYEIVMESDDGSLDRQLTAWQESGSGKSGEPNEAQVSPAILQGLAGKYPRRVTIDPNAARQTFAGRFTGRLPGELGGAGEYRIIHTPMGSAAGYVERFAGTDDLTYQLERINLAADTITDVLGGYLASRLDKHPGFEKLRRFMDTDFRKDIKNLSIYLWSANSGLVSSEENKMEIRARVVLYLIEHDYVHYEHIFEFARQMADPAVKDEDTMDKIKAGELAVRRFLARKMGIDETDKQLAFLADPNEVAQSFEQFVRTNEAVRQAVERWQERSASWSADEEGSHVASSQPTTGPATEPATQPATAQSQPATEPASEPAQPDAMKTIGEAADVLAQDIIGAFLPLGGLFGPASDQVSVKLKLPAQPLISNGQWDNKSRGLAWSFNNRPSPLSHICYAVWASPDAGFQKEHFGRVILDGQGLALYCGWQKCLTADEARQWDDVLKTVRPATAEAELSRFRAEHQIAVGPESAPASQPATTASTTMPASAPTTAPAPHDSYVAYGAGMILDALARPGQ